MTGLERILNLGSDVENFQLGRCGPSDDPDMQTAYLYAFKDVATRFVAAAKRIDDVEVKTASLNLNPESITDAYDLKADLVPIIDLIREKSHDPFWGEVKGQRHNLVEPAFLNRIKTLKNAKFDLSKFLRFTEELNENYDRGNYLSCALLIRAIINHVPPIFGCQAFAQVVANSGRSKKTLLGHLEESARGIGDLHSHETVDRFSAVPTKNQIDPYKPSLEILLSEIERVVGAYSSP